MSSLLVTILGTNPKPARYVFEAREAEASLAPLALVQLLPIQRRPSRIVALCTAEAKSQSWPLLKQGLADSGIDVAIVEIGEDPTDVTSFLRIVTTAIPAGDALDGLMIDTTHGFRHYAVLTYLTIQYLSALRGIELQNAFYGIWRPIEEGSSPFLDLRALLALPEWIYALRVFGDAGDASHLGRLIESDGDQAARAMAKELRHISEAREAGLPLELGQTSATFRANREKLFKKALRAQGALLDDELWLRLKEPLERFGFDTQKQAQSWKKQIVLNGDELKRQAALVDDLLDRGSIAVALGLMNEWTVSRVILQMEKQGSWLDYRSVRRAAAAALGALSEFAQDQALGKVLSDPQRKLGSFWRDLSDLRNAFHHHGMRPRVLVGAGANDTQPKLDGILDAWDSLKTLSDLAISLPVTSKRLLVSAVGRSPGVLYSAIEACRSDGLVPEDLLLLVSDETSASVADALRETMFIGAVHSIRISDPYGGQSEIEPLLQEARAHLAAAEEVVVNLTGGTTLMGLAVAAIADEARRLARDVRRFGLIDRRRPSEQEAAPYRIGETFWLDPRSANGD
jgi:hypothetical protein